jgi:putative inorganic carbon (HCO3(-)) transporter
MLEDFPLTGVGMGAYPQVADTLYPFFIYPPGKITHAHNLYLQVGVDLGLPGLAAWLAALMGAVWAAWRAFDPPLPLDPTHAPEVASAAALLAAFSGLIIHGLFDAVTWGTRPAILVWVLMALAVALYHRSLSTPPQEGRPA